MGGTRQVGSSLQERESEAREVRGDFPKVKKLIDTRVGIIYIYMNLI